MGGNNNYNWLYYRIYPGSLMKLDNAVEHIVIPAKKIATERYDVNQWFFMRYMDATGAHLRLRFHVKDTELPLLWNSMDSVLKQNLEMVIQKQSNKLKRLVPYKQDDKESTPSIKIDLYEPEQLKYIDQKYLNLSEKMFQYSSELVCSVINDINNEKINRYELGLVVMNCVFEAIGLVNNILYRFLQNYLNYWSGSERMSRQLLSIAQSKKDLMESILSYDINRTKYHIEVERYVNKVKKILFEAKSKLGEEEFLHLLFHYTHMMNNRFGIWPIEEAYLCALMIENLQDVPIQ